MSKEIYLKPLILNLLNEKKVVNLSDIAQEAGLDSLLSKDRRAIQRVLSALIQDNLILVEGKARARAYSINNKMSHSEAVESVNDAFQSTQLSTSASRLLEYLSKPIGARKPVGYEREFLLAYQPNKSYYLDAALRKELFDVGQVENVVRPAGTYARNILNRLLVDLSWNSSRLEGNTYSLLETKRLIELGENAEGKDASEAQMILNHKDAIEYIIESADDKKISAHEICSIHALLSNNLLGDPSASGRIREIAVGISGTTYLPLDNPHVLKENFDIFIEKLNLIRDPFEQSFFSMIHLSYLQAFEDVNKRTARLAANISLIKRNLKPLSFIDVNQTDYVKSLLGIYEKNDVSLMRDLYVWAYHRSAQRYSAMQQSLGEPNGFKLKYRNAIQEIVREIILHMIPGNQVVTKIKEMIATLNLSEQEAIQLLQIIETEIMSLHDGNIARFKIRPSEFQRWKSLR